MRYNENDGEEVNGRIVITDEIAADSIFENSCVVANNICAKTIRANFDLVVIGDVEADRIDVAGKFVCTGNCNFEEMAIQGSCTIDGNLNVESGFVGDSLKAFEICAEDLEVKGSISCTNLECNHEVICDKNVLILEGLMGTGTLYSKMTLCGEYSMIEAASGVFVADTLEMELPHNIAPAKALVEESAAIDIDEWKEKERRLSPNKFYDELCKLADENEKYKAECSAYKKIMLMDNIIIPPSIKTYVDMMDLFSKKFEIVSKTKIYARVKVKFQSWTYDDINHSKMSKISQKEFAKMLHVLMFKPQIFDEEVRQLILETLFITIGADYEDVCSVLEG